MNLEDIVEDTFEKDVIKRLEQRYSEKLMNTILKQIITNPEKVFHTMKQEGWFDLVNSLNDLSISLI